MFQPLLATKVRIPPAGAGWLARGRLLEMLDAALRPGQRLALITAPAGYGKTTLLAEWARRLGGAGGAKAPRTARMCWLSLDESDNHPARFLAYLIEALRPALPKDAVDVDQAILEPLRASDSPDPRPLLTALLNQLLQVEGVVVLVIDDYQVISSPVVGQAVRFFVQNQPENVRLAVASRVEPALGQPGLRARRQLVEIHTADLAFTPQEAQDYYLAAEALPLSPGEISLLQDRTEGWAAGLQMAAVYLRGREGAGPGARLESIQAFSSSPQPVIEYLMDEVFSQQPPAVQSFLLKTSILERMCAALCQALLGAEAPPDCRQVLEDLAQANLFVVALDERREWFRYHHLFAGLLRARLERTTGASAIQQLALRAAHWYESQGLIPDAIGLALSSGNAAYTGDLLERNILTFFYQSEIYQVHRWLSALPEQQLVSRPLLCAVMAGATALLPPYPPETIEAAEAWMQEAEAGLMRRPGASPQARAFILSIRSYWVRFRREPPEKVIALIRQAEAFLVLRKGTQANLDDLRIQSALQTNLGLTQWEMGSQAEARATFEKAVQLGRFCGDFFNEAASTNSLARIFIVEGQLGDAARLCRDALSIFAGRQRALGRPAPFSGEIGITLAEVLIEQNELAEAEALVSRNMELARWTMSHNIIVRGALALARIALARGQAAEALARLDEARAVSREGADYAGAARVGCWARLGRADENSLERAEAWAARNWPGFEPVEFQHGRPQSEWVMSLALVRLRIAILLRRGIGDGAELARLLAWLDCQAGRMRRRGLAHWEIMLRLAECAAFFAGGEEPKALASLRRAVQLGEPGGYVLCFVEAGEPVERLLGLLSKEPGAPKAYLRALRSAFEPPAGPPATSAGTGPTTGALAEPLTARETEVLKLVYEGLSNQEIAARLVVSPNTVKKHIYSVFQKLEVKNRAQAIYAARRLGIVA